MKVNLAALTSQSRDQSLGNTVRSDGSFTMCVYDTTIQGLSGVEQVLHYLEAVAVVPGSREKKTIPKPSRRLVILNLY